MSEPHNIGLGDTGATAVENPPVIGLSPKTIAAAIASYVAVVLAGLLADAVGVEIEADLLEGLLVALLVPAITAASAFLAKVGKVAVTQTGSGPVGAATTTQAKGLKR